MLSREDRDICDNIEKYIGHCFVGKNESINWASISMVIIGKEVRSLKAFFVLSALYCRVWLLWHWAFLSSNPTICMPVFQRRNWLYASLFFFSFLGLWALFIPILPQYDSETHDQWVWHLLKVWLLLLHEWHATKEERFGNCIFPLSYSILLDHPGCRWKTSY